MNILHVTDFHIDDVNNIEEKLRKKFYQEFLDDPKRMAIAGVGATYRLWIFKVKNFFKKKKFLKND